MNTRTMEGIVGASTNMNLIDTPMRVYKEARRRGDQATMERSMGYVGEFSGKVEEYRSEAEEGMKKDAKDAREKAEAERERAIEKRREEREKLEKKIEEGSETDTLEVSGEGNRLLKDNIEAKRDTVKEDSTGEKANTEAAPVIYTKAGETIAGEAGRAGQGAGISISI